MKTLFSEIQSLFERTYANVGLNLEECLVDTPRSRQLAALAGAQSAELAHHARTFLRAADGQLRIGIYYSQWLIEQLERNDPRAGIGDHNIRELIAFVEEINHALHAALQFRAGTPPTRDENYARNLELQSGVDTYLVLTLFMAFFRRPKPLTRFDRRWLRFHLFVSRGGAAYASPLLRERYEETTHLARIYADFLESLTASRRVAEIRAFRALSYPEKQRHILALENRRETGSAD